jgi:ATP-binding cassette subfamily F protein 3
MIRLENLKKNYGTKVILNDVSYHFPAGERIALVGANGAGKSTLLNMICSLEEQDYGDILIPSTVKFGYLPQEPNPNPKSSVLEEALTGAIKLTQVKEKIEIILHKMETEYSEDVYKKYEKLEEQFTELGGHTITSKAKGILVGLGFSNAQFEQDPLNLSGGWRMRLELAKVFLNDPDFLILDEPTNHLDLPSLIWVENYLQSFKGTLLFVSHDRDLLNKLSTVTLHLNNGQLNFYKGNFDYFLEEREKRIELDAKSLERLQKRMAQLERFVERFKAKASKAKQAQSRMKMLTKMRDFESGFIQDSDPEEIMFSFRKPLPSGKEILHIKQMDIGYEKVLAKNINQKIHRGQKIAVIGANGIGKSTLLKTISEIIEPLAGSYEYGHNVIKGYFAQDQMDTFDGNENLLENLLNVSMKVTEKQARNLLGNFLFKGDDVYKPVHVLSGGEKSRLGLAALLLKEANFLILDEPTNHLDMSSCEMLANALDEYEGTAFFVSHDRIFIDAVCTHIFAMTPDGKSALFQGKLADFEHLAQISGFPNILQNGSAF